METMIYGENCTLPKEYLEQLMRQGLEGLPDLVREIVNEAMQIERGNYQQANPYERSEGSPLMISSPPALLIFYQIALFLSGFIH